MNQPPDPHDHVHETSDVRPKQIAQYGVGLVVLVTAALVLMAAMFSYFTQRETVLDETASPLSQGPVTPPEPQLQSDPPVDLKQMRAEEDANLNSYGWVDQEHGVVRIPIERAIDAVVDQGLPKFEAQEQEPGAARAQR